MDSDIPKKRGRPRKNQMVTFETSRTDQKEKVDKKDIDTREIILRFPKFTMSERPNPDETAFAREKKNPYDREMAQAPTVIDRTRSEHFDDRDMQPDPDLSDGESKGNQNAFTTCDDMTINMLTDEANTISDAESSDSNSVTVDELIIELKRKDSLIKQLKNEVAELRKTVPQRSTVGRNVKTQVMNINFIDNRSGVQRVCEETDVCCWWCTEKFDTFPCFIPERFNDNKFYVFGCFCSFNCAKRYNIELLDYKVFDRDSLLNRLYSTIYPDSTGSTIQLAGPRESLTKFGGPLSIDEFRANFYITGKDYRLLLPPMVNLVACIEERTKEKTRDVHKERPKEDPDKNKKTDNMSRLGLKEVVKETKKGKFTFV